MSEGLTTSIEFDLPVGYEDEKGTLHKTVVMRRLKNTDIIAVQADMEIKSLAGANVDMYSGNPAQVLISAAATAQVYAILYPRVVLKIGAIDKPDRKVFENLFVTDAGVLFQKYLEFNGFSLKKGEPSPFAPGANS